MTLHNDFIERAISIIESAAKKDIPLRLMGACAVRVHCSEFRKILDSMKRSLTDIDFVSYGNCNRSIGSFFTELGLTQNERCNALHGRTRQIYYDNENGCVLDVFFDKLEMCHTIDFRGRLELDYPTITLADIFFEKMQIVKINEKDIKDVIVLIREHNVGSTDSETINSKYIAETLASNWGFYYTVITNFGKVRDFLGKYESLTADDQADVNSKLDKLLQSIEVEPKTVSWRMRARIGPRKKWYADVEAVDR